MPISSCWPAQASGIWTLHGKLVVLLLLLLLLLLHLPPIGGSVRLDRHHKLPAAGHHRVAAAGLPSSPRA